MADNNTPRTFTDADFEDDPTNLKPVKTSAARKLGDLAIGFGQGAVGATKALSDAFGANNAVSQGLEGVNKGLDSFLSAETKDRQFEADRIQQEAKGKGIAAEVAGFGKAFATDPAQMMAQGAGSIVPNLAVQFIPGVGQSATAARLAQVGMGLGMGAGTAKGAIHEEVQKRELAAGKTAEQAQAAADAAQAYGGANTDQIALGAGLGLADALTGATPAAVRLLRQKLGKEVLEETGKKAGEGIFKAGAKGALAEMPVEFAQGGQEQLAANIAAQRAGYQADTWEGVVGKGGMEALASAGPGAAFGIAGRNRGADPQPQPDPPNASQPSVTPLLGYQPDQLVVFPDGTVGRRGEVEQYVASLPESQQNAARAKLYGFAPQQAEPTFSSNLNADTFDSNATPTLDARALEAAGVSMPPPAAVLDSGRIDRMVDLGTEQQPINASEQQGGPKNSDEDGYLGSSITPISIGGQEAFIAQHPENVMRQMQGIEQNPRLNKIAASRQDAERLIGDMWLGYGNKDNDKLVQDFLSNANGSSTYAEPLSEVPTSKRMGLDAAAGPLSAAAVTAVDSGASPAAAALASGVGGGFGIGRAARGEPVDVTPINQSAGQIGATKRNGEIITIDGEMRWKDDVLRLGYDGERKGAATRLAERPAPAQAPQQQPSTQYQANTVRAPESRQNTVQPSAEPPRLGMTPAQQRTPRQQPPVRDGSTPIAMGMETYAGKDIPKAVKDKLKFAVSRLNSVKFTLDSVKKARGDGHHLATEVARQKDTYDKYASIIADFKQKAEKIGVNLSPFLDEIGDVSESVGAYFNKNIASTDGNKSVTPQKDVVNQAAGAFAQALAGGKSRDDAAKAAADVVISNTGGGGAAFASTKEAGKAVTAAVKQGLAQDTQRIATAPLSDGGMSDDALAQALGIDDGGNMGGAGQKTVAPEDLYKAAGAVLGTPKPQGSERAPDAKAATTEATAQSKDVAPVFLEPPPVAHYRLKEYKSGYGKWSYVLPGVGKSYSDKDKKDLVSWFKSAGWESEINEGRVFVRPKEGDSLDDIPMSPSEKAIFEKKREAYLKSQEIAAKKEAEIAALKNTVEYSFVNGLLGDNANSATKIALAKYLTGEKFEGIGGNWVFHLKDAGIDVGDGVQVAHALKGLSAAYKKQSSSTAEAAPAPVNARPSNWRKNMISAAKVAKGMGIVAKGKKLVDLVAEIDAADAASVTDETPWSDVEEKRLMSLIGRNGSIYVKEVDGYFVAQVIGSDKDNKYARATGKTKLSAKRALLKKLSESQNPPQDIANGKIGVTHEVVESRRGRFEVRAKASSQPTPSQYTSVGKNYEGKELVQDANGVRSYVENGVRSQEAVSMRLGPSGVRTNVARRRDEFKTVEELDKQDDTLQDPEMAAYERGLTAETRAQDFKKLSESKKSPKDTEAGAPSSTQADNIDPLLNKLASGYGYSGGIDTMPAGLGTTARKLHKAIIDGDVAMVQKILHPDNKRSREAFEKLFDGRVQLPSTVRDTNTVIQGFMGKVSAALAENVSATKSDEIGYWWAVGGNGGNGGPADSLTEVGRTAALKAVGISDKKIDNLKKRSWIYLPDDVRAKLEALRLSGWKADARPSIEKPSPSTKDLMDAAQRNGKLIVSVVGDKPVAQAASTVEFIKALEEAKKELPAGYSISPQIGSLSLMQNGKYAINGLSRTADGVREAVRLAKLREAEAKKDEAIKNEQPKPLPDDSILDDELKDALGKLGDVLGDVFGAKLNATGQQYTAGDLLPALSKVVELLVKKGFKSFSQSTGKAAQLMRADPRTAAHVDSISPRQWKAAYNAIAEGFEGTDSEDTINAMKADEVLAIVAPLRPAVQNPQKTENDNAALEKPSQKALGNVPTKNDSRPEGSRKAGASPASGGNQSGNSGAGVDGERVSTTRSGGGGASGVSDSATGAARAGRPRGDGTAGNGAGVPPTDGRLNTPETASAPNIPSANFAITPDLKLGTGGEVVKFNDNIAAIKTLKTLETERRRATPDEQRVLARFVGWGGLANAFPNPETGEFKSEWVKRGNELRDLLTPSEYRAASRSTRNAHYTSETVVGAMWDAARRLGYRNGLALESSMGSGNFLGLMPRDMAARFIGVEYDSITARLAGALYPQATVLHSGFQDVALPDGAFDLDIGNPPFGSESLRFQYKPELKGLSIHNQFFLAGIDALRPGGLKISVVSSFLMDAQDRSTRLALAKKANLVAAIRLPTTAFKENARTEVVTDIVILQRRTKEDERRVTEAVEMLTKPLSAKEQRDMSPLERQRRAELADEYRKELRWVTTSPVKDPLGGEPILVNSYFADNPNQIIGTMDRSGTMRTSGMMNVRLDDPATLGKRLGELVDKLPKDILSTAKDVAERTEEAYKLLGESLRISVARQEPGQVLFDEDGNLVRVVEREYGDGTLLQRQVLTPQSPFSSQLFLDSMGRWYKVDVRMDADGKPMKLVKDGKATKLNEYVRTNYEKESDIPESMRLGQLNYERMKDLAGMRDLLKRQLVLETEDAPKVMMEGNRKKLALAYKAYVDKHGPINRRSNAALLSEMPDGGLVLALESDYEPARTAEQAKRSGLPQQSETVKPAPIMRERVVPKYSPPTSASTPADALAISLAERGVVDMEHIAKLLNQSTEKAAAALTGGESPLVFKDPETNTFETANAYLSGQVRRKLMAAKSAGLEQNIKALESVQPERWGAEKVSVQIGATWVPSEVYADFAKHLMGGTASVHHSALTNTFSVKVHNEDRGKSDQWATERMSGVKILEKLLNSQTPNVMTKDMDGNLRLDKDATALAILKGREIVAEFDDWIFKDGDRRELLVDQFNEKFNTRVMRQYDGQHLTLPGKVPDTIIKMRRHQLNAIWRGISSRFMLVDHTVGAGKTFTAIARAMERRRMGLAKKPTVVVPNHLVEQWAADVYRLYPAAKVLAATKKDFEKSNRRRLLSRVATGDYDIVILPHSSFGFVGIAPETELRYLEEELKQALAAVGEAEKQAEDDGDVGFRKPLGVKEAERLVAKIESRMANLRNSARDRLLTFEQLGIDDLTIDEAHEFKNLFYSSRLTKVRGMGDKIGSRKAADLYNKVRVLRDSGGAITFMTGTPVSNSVVELYTMMRYLAPNELREMGMEHFDAWRAQFVDASPAFEPNESGRLQEVTRLGRTWSNMRNMMDLYYTFTDAVTNDDIKKWYREDNSGKEFPIPKVKGGDRQLRKVIPTEAQESYLKEIIAGFDGLPDIKDIQERNATRLRLMDLARKLSLDVRAALPGSTSKEKGGKLEQIASEVKRIYAKTTKDLGTQIVFLDRSVPKAKGDDKKIKEFDALIAKRDKALSDGDDIGFQKINETLEAYDSQEIEELRIAQSGGWNAYKQLKENMIALGIPADEIRFVQDANTDEQKQALFDAVNGGKVRVLIGSTPRMGAGTNVQQRLVGLHHADVTWKPSDIEQREGRIIRQGNLFATPPTADKPNPLYQADFEVEILAYATERTVDAKMWSLNATKLKAINGLRKYTGDFTMELDDEESVSMAEMAALASGNPLLLERVTLESDIQKLELQERSHRRKVHGAEDEVKRAKNIIETYPERIKEARELVTDMKPRVNELSKRASSRVVSIDGKQFKHYFDAMVAVANSITAQQAGNEHARYAVDVNGIRLTNKNAIDEAVSEGFGDSEPFEVEIQGETFTRRISAGRELAEVLSPKAALMADRGTIGSMLGLDLKYEFSKREGGRIDMELWLERNGKTVASDGRWGHDPYQKFTTSQMRDLIGNIARSAMNSAHHGTGDWFEEKLNEARSNIQRLMEQTKEAFPKAQELKDKRQRLKDVVATLTSDNTKPTEDDTLKMSRGGAALPPTITVDGKERPTTNSNGQQIAATEEGVRNFWRWFGDSKVVDDDGRPMVVYHGTRNKRFNAFDWGKAREGTYGTGFYFTTDRSRADDYAGSGGRVIEAYLKVDNLFDTRLQKTIGDGSGKNFGVSSIDEFMVERPTQIKSAAGKNGTFDPQNPNILKSGQGQTVVPQPDIPRTPKAKIKAALDKAYGRLFGRLEAKGLVTLTQTQQEAIEAAARARADQLGRDYDDELATMLASVNSSSIGGESTAIDVKYSADGLIQGFFDPATNRAYIVSDALFEDTAAGVLMHEVGIHMAASGGKLTPLVNRAAFMVKNAKGAFFDDVRKKMAKAGETSAEEAAAYLVEAYENSRGSAPSAVKQWFKDFMAAVRAWLFKAGGGLILSANQLTAADIAAVARANARGFARGGAGRMTMGQSVRRSFAGEGALTANKDALAEAKKRVGKTMLEQLKAKDGKERVFSETGWFKGVDGKWRFEIDDSKADIDFEKILAAIKTKAAAIEKASALSKILGEITAERKAFLKSQKQTPSKISAAVKAMPEFQAIDAKFKKAERDLSEMQFNFFKTGSLILGDVLAHKELFDAYPHLKNVQIMLSNSKDVGGSMSYMNGIYTLEIAEQTISKGKDWTKSVMLHEIQHAIQSDEGFAVGSSVETLKNNREEYTRSAGETESRNVQARMDMSQAQRKASYPTRTQDRHNSQLIVDFGKKNGMPSASMPIQSTDERGFPVINGDGVTLQFGEPVERIEFIPVHDSQRMIRFQIGTESNPFAGMVDVLFENDKPIALYDIEVYQSERGKKTASKAVKALLDASPNGKLEVSNIVTEAQEFWATFGIPTQPNLPKGYAYDGTITTKSFNSSPAAKNTRAAGGVAEDWFEAWERDHGGRTAIEDTSRIQGVEVQELSWEDAQKMGIRFSRTGGNGQPPTGAVPNYFDVKGAGGRAKEGMADRLADWRGMSMQALGRRQIVDLWGKLLPQLGRYDDLVQKMDAEKNATAAGADELATAWAELDGKGFLGLGKAKNAGMEAKLAELMHDATLGGVDADPSVPLPSNATVPQKMAKGAFAKRFDALTPDAQAVYRKVRDIYADQNKAIRKALTGRIERAAELSPDSKRTMIAQMDADMMWEKRGVYFPLSRFGKYVVVVKDASGKTMSVSRAETLPESKKLRAELQSRYPSDQGFRVSKVYLDHEFNAARDAVGKGFMGDLVQTLRNEGMDEGVIDSVGQLYLKSLPDLSWAKHGIHRKGTPGFSQDARRAFAQNMIHGASHLAKLRYADRLQMELSDMQAHIKANQDDEGFDNIKAVQVYDEMVKRHDNLMSPKTHPLSTALTSAGFLFYLGLSPASAAVNLSQTALLAYPIMGAKWGYDKAGAALLKASAEVTKAKNDYRSALQGDELRALNQAIDDGTIDVTMAHDLAGIAGGEDQRVTWAMRPAMRAASFMFHHAEKFNRQATFIAAYRLARDDPKTTHEQAFAEARKATYDGHFDYSAANRPRVMQGNWAKVLLLFKQYGQNMVYTLARQTYLSIKGDTPEQKKEARKAIAGILVLHASAAGALGLPVVGTLLALASAMGGDDDEPWDAKVAIQNALAESLGQKPAEVLAHGLSRLTPWDMSGRVALNSLILPDVQEGLEGQRLAESAMTAALGPVAGIGVGLARGVQKMSQGDYARGFEDMLPVSIRNPLKAMRYATEGNVDKTGVVINDEVSAAGVAGQALGFAPSETRLAAEGKQAIYQADKRLSERRAQLMRLYSMAKMADDDEGVTEARESIARFNAKNPDRKITVIQLAQSVKSRQKRIAEAQQGVYLPEKRRGALEAGRFAVAE